MTILGLGSTSRVLHIRSKVSCIQSNHLYGSLKNSLGAVVASSANQFDEPSTFIDPLSEPASCTRDVSYLKQLNVNTIRVYSVNSSLDHDGCMSTFSAAGIYTMLAFMLLAQKVF